MPTSTQTIAFDAGTNATSGKTTKNYAAIKTMPLSSSPVQDAFLYAPRPFLLGSTIISSTLRVYQTAAATGGTRTLTARRLAAKFTESKITSANKPGVTGATATLAQGNGGVAGRVWDIDVTALAQEVADGSPWYGFRITSDIATLMSIFSSENSTFRPVWINAWSVAPKIPTMLSPGGGRAVSLARPTFRFDFVDTADDSLLGFQIQFSASADFTTPTFDTGTVVASQPSWAPSTDIALGATTWWRVRTQDQAGLWSPWAVPVSFVRTAKGAVTITNPAAAPNDFVTEATPPITATFSGVVTAYQIFIVDPEIPANVRHDSTKITGSTIAYTLPKGVLKTTVATYRLIVRAWDDVARESTPGDMPYVVATRDFTFELSNTVGPVTGLQALDPGITHGAGFVFSRSTAPDAFVLEVDGVVTGDEYAPADILVSGTSYKIDYYGADPIKNHVIKVLCVVNGVTSDNNPAVSFATEPQGIWLSGEDGENPVCILTDGDIPAWGSTEMSATHQAVGSRFAVVRTQNLGSAQGSVKGWLVGDQGGLEEVPIATWEARANALRSPAGQKLRLALTNTNTPVYVSNMVIEPADEHGDIAISFDFHERA